MCFSRQYGNFNTGGAIVEQLISGANCLTPDGDTFQLVHNSQITIIVDPAD